MTVSPGFLAGVRVIELAALTNGDYLGMLLADLGADVIKVEDPERGDYIRDILGQIAPGHSPSHEQFNRGKRSVTLDLKSAAGLETFWQLMATADVLIDGYVAGTLDRLGIGHDETHRRFPNVIYCSVTGLGSTGPYAELPTHGRMMNALAGGKPHEMGADGFMHAIPDGSPMAGTTVAGQGPILAGLFGAQYVLAALLAKFRDGRGGSFIDVSGADCVVAASPQGSVYAWNDHLITDRSTMPVKTDAEEGSATYQYYEASDGQAILLGALERKLWLRFCEAVGRPDLLDRVGAGEVDFAAGQTSLRRDLQALFGTRASEEWMDLALTHRLPLVPAYKNPREALRDPHLRSREVIHFGQLPGDLGEFLYVGRPAVIPGQPFHVTRPAPDLGEHTDEVLAELNEGKRR